MDRHSAVHSALQQLPLSRSQHLSTGRLTSSAVVSLLHPAPLAMSMLSWDLVKEGVLSSYQVFFLHWSRLHKIFKFTESYTVRHWSNKLDLDRKLVSAENANWIAASDICESMSVCKNRKSSSFLVVWLFGLHRSQPLSDGRYRAKAKDTARLLSRCLCFVMFGNRPRCEAGLKWQLPHWHLDWSTLN